MDIHGENSFKAKSYAIAAFHIEKLPEQLSETPKEKIALIKGLGESSAKKIIEILETGSLQILKEIVEKTPTGVIEMLNIKGIGPKKITVIWKEMGIESIGELLYACNENRLTLYKGFGEKTQKSIQESIEYFLNNVGSYLYAQVDELVDPIGYMQMAFTSCDIVHIRIFLLLIHQFRIFYQLYNNFKFIPQIKREVISASVTIHFYFSSYFELQQHKTILFFQV